MPPAAIISAFKVTRYLYLFIYLCMYLFIMQRSDQHLSSAEGITTFALRLLIIIIVTFVTWAFFLSGIFHYVDCSVGHYFFLFHLSYCSLLLFCSAVLPYYVVNEDEHTL